MTYLDAVPAGAELLGEPGSGHTASETSYLGFSVPEFGIDAVIYHWMHPNLGVLSGGVAVWSRLASWVGDADHFRFQDFLPLPTTDIDNVRYATGVHVTVIEPFGCLTATYMSEDSSLAFDVRWDAIAPPAGKPGGNNFTQPMRTSGYVRVNGTEHNVDGYYTRNRSFQVLRDERASFPRHNWSAPIFGDDLAFLIVAEDSATLSAAPLHWGYVAHHGELRSIAAVRQSTCYASGFPGNPSAIRIEVEDDCGQQWKLQGHTLSNLPFAYWPMMHANLALMRWSSADGRVGYGDCQDFRHSSQSGDIEPR